MKLKMAVVRMIQHLESQIFKSLGDALSIR